VTRVFPRLPESLLEKHQYNMLGAYSSLSAQSTACERVEIVGGPSCYAGAAKRSRCP
jgi:hypothetical protein